MAQKYNQIDFIMVHLGFRDGVDTYQKYEQFLEAENNTWPQEVQEQVFNANAKKNLI